MLGMACRLDLSAISSQTVCSFNNLENLRSMSLKTVSFKYAYIALLLILFCGQSVTAQAGLLTGYTKRSIEKEKPAHDLPILTQPTPQLPSEPALQQLDESVWEGEENSEAGADPVDFQADNLVHDEEGNIIRASGNVMLVQNGRILRADQIVYDLNRDIVKATGHVVLNEESGEIYYAEKLLLKNSMKDGLVTTLHTYLADGSRFIAESGKRQGGNKTTMNGTIFTPCKVCEKGETPAWQIRASEVSHDKLEKTISYRNARFEFFGIPVAYTPYFSHSDGSVKQESGFLAPSMKYKSSLGAAIGTKYYWALNESEDLTVGLTAFTKQLPLGTVEYRRRWADASLEVSGGITYAERDEKDAGVTVTKDEEVRGHVFAEGLWNINDKWRAGTNIALASDDQYMNQYDFSGEDILENELYVERFANRDYFTGRLIGFQDTRTGTDKEDQPMLLPEIVASFKGDPNAVPVVGGNWSVEGSYMGLRREGEDQDVDRMSLQTSWQRRLISRTGLLTSVDASVRGDVYHVNDANDLAGRSSESESRLFPQMHVESKYPLAKQFEKSQMTVEPLVAVTIAPNVDVDDSIPNEDSQDVQIDASNLFEANRFPGYDRLEDRSRVTYGLRTGLYGHDGSYGNIFLGQSYRFDEDDNPFPAGSGLNRRESDIVGQISANYAGNYKLDYRFQLDSESLSSQRHEVDAGIDFDRFSFDADYLFATALDGTNITENREQISADASYYWDHEWRSRIGATQDLGDSPGLREAYLGLDYLGECLSWSLTGERNLTDDSSGDSSTEIMFTIGLKNIGEFQESGYKSSEEQSCGIMAP